MKIEPSVEFEEQLLIELKEIKHLFQVIMINQEKKENLKIQMSSVIEERLYNIEESLIWLKNGGNYLGDAKGHAGIPYCE